MDDIETRLRKVVAEHLDCTAEEAEMTASIIDDLGGDSLDKVELVMAVEEEFDLTIDTGHEDRISLVGDFLPLIRAAPARAA